MRKGDFKRSISINGDTVTVFDINLLEEQRIAEVSRLPFSIKVLVENLLRNLDGRIVSEKDLLNISQWKKRYDSPVEIPFHPSRVLMQDFTGVPAVVDLAAMRDAVKNLGGDPRKINPLVPVDLIIDHSVQVDFFGSVTALEKNVAAEYRRNQERYLLLKWAQKNFDNFRVVPPNSGICHQVNLEYIGRVIGIDQREGQLIASPDTLVGTDSHTTMVNGIGIVGWGVGGIEAEAVMLGQPYHMSIPEVIGVKLTGELREGITATDLVLTLTEFLRKYNVVEKFVEYFGPGAKSLTPTDRATLSNMTPEYGATIGFFPVDEKTIEYLKITGRAKQAAITEKYTKALGLFYTGENDPTYSEVLEFDISRVDRSVAGPARPKDRIDLKRLKTKFTEILNGKYEKDTEFKYISNFFNESGSGTYRMGSFEPSCTLMRDFGIDRDKVKIQDGSIVIAAITSCTNTSNPHVMMGAGLLARKAVKLGLRVSPYIKTSLVPGSRVVIDYLQESGLLPYLEALGFHLTGFGCTTCIGNSGPLNPEIERAISENCLTVAAVLSGNRNFEARIHQSVQANFLMSPMLVVAFALAGRIDIDFSVEPIGTDPNFSPVFLKDIWPSDQEIAEFTDLFVKLDFFVKEYETIFDGDAFWKNLPAPEQTTFEWALKSTYIKRPPYFEEFTLEKKKPSDIQAARVLLLLGDSVTTDHISPAGSIPKHYPAGCYLESHGVAPADFNSYGSRRGNHEVMMRGTFGNIRVKNKLVAPREGSFTKKFPEEEEMFIYDAAVRYKEEGIPLIVIGGKEYGTGSSRDWAAKGAALLGVKAVIAESFERIHRSNLVGMGVLPMEFMNGDTSDRLGIDGSETFFISGIEALHPREILTISAVKPDGREAMFQVTVRLDTDMEVDYFESGGILHYVLRKIISG